MSVFGDKFTNDVRPRMVDILGDSATFTVASTQATSTVDVLFVEFVGAVDEKQRAIFTVPDSNAGGVNGVASPVRGDQLTLSGTVWTVIDIRTDEAGLWELRCDSPEAVN